MECLKPCLSQKKSRDKVGARPRIKCLVLDHGFHPNISLFFPPSLLWEIFQTLFFFYKLLVDASLRHLAPGIQYIRTMISGTVHLVTLLIVEGVIKFDILLSACKFTRSHANIKKFWTSYQCVYSCCHASKELIYY